MELNSTQRQRPNTRAAKQTEPDIYRRMEQRENKNNKKRNLWRRRDDGGLSCDWRDWDHRDYGRGGRGGLGLLNNSMVRGQRLDKQCSTDEQQEEEGWKGGWSRMYACRCWRTGVEISVPRPVCFHHVEEPAGRSLTHRTGRQSVREVGQSQAAALWLTDYLTLQPFRRSWCDKLCTSAALWRLKPYYVSVCVCVWVCVWVCVCVCVLNPRSLGTVSAGGGCPFCDYWKAADISISGEQSINPDSQLWHQHWRSKVNMLQWQLVCCAILYYNVIIFLSLIESLYRLNIRCLFLADKSNQRF